MQTSGYRNWWFSKQFDVSLTEKKEEFTFEFEDIPKEKYDELEKLLLKYMDVEISREDYLKEVEKLLKND